MAKVQHAMAAFVAAGEGVRQAAQAAGEAGFTPEVIQAACDMWSTATDTPHLKLVATTVETSL